MNFSSPLSRREAFTLATAALAGSAMLEKSDAQDPRITPSSFKTIEDILDAKGQMMNGVFQIPITRTDIRNVTLRNVPIHPAFLLNGAIYFQYLPDGRVAMNADSCFQPDELNRVIDELVRHDIAFQALHQHFYAFSPMVWFIHYRAAGDPEKIAHGIKVALNRTATPFPQRLPLGTKTPLPCDEISGIIGAPAHISADGMVNFDLPRSEQVTLGGIPVNPYLNIATSIHFQPHGGRENAAAVVNFSMIAPEINKVMAVMRRQGWDVGCLYNQETGEYPQLFFSHQFKTGNAIRLAREIRRGLDQTNSTYRQPVTG